MNELTWSLYILLAIWTIGSVLNTIAMLKNEALVDKITTANLSLMIFIPAPIILLDYLIF